MYQCIASTHSESVYILVFMFNECFTGTR